jgi:mRNA interferase MazF
VVTSSEGYVPERGDAVWISLDPRMGREQAGRRPALILSPSAYNGRVGLAILCPITNQVKGFPFEVAIPPGLSVSGVVLADHAKSQDWRARQAVLICRVPDSVVNRVAQRLTTLVTGFRGLARR